MLKIKKTKPYQFRKLHNNSVTYNNSSNKSKLYTSRVLCSLALICGIVPSLALLSNYNVTPVSAARKTLSNITAMQEMTPEICANSAKYQSNTLVDVRDNKSYKVTRLDDGNCWMTENLRIVNMVIYGPGVEGHEQDSNLAAGATFKIEPSSTWTETSADANRVYYGDDTNYGAYYSWYAATAGSGTSTVAEETSASYSICPKGWKLPTKDEYSNLLSITGFNKTGGASLIQNSPYNFTSAGVFYADQGALGNVGTGGRYWTSTASNGASYAYAMYFASANAYLHDTATRYNGRPVRCLAPASNTDFPEPFDEKDSTVSVTVPKVLTIDAVSKALTLEANPNQIIEGNISAAISANTTYAVQLSASKTSLTNSASSEEPTSTNSIPASSNVTPKTNAWGILNQDNSTYSAITSAPTTYHNAETTNENSSKTHTFTLGVSVSPTLPAGEYSTTVTITAVNN